MCGVGESAYGRRLGRSAIDLAADAIQAAVADAGLTKSDIDGMAVTFGSPLGADADTLAFALGLELKAYNQTWAHGRFTGTALQWAAMTVAAGLADVVACLAAVSFTGVRRLRVGGGGDREGAREGGGGHGEDPVYGMTSPGAGAALMARKYMARYGATSDDLAAVPMALRHNATLNPLAMYQTPLTLDDYRGARYVAEPLRIFDYCQVNDGAACVLVTTPERAADLAQPPVLIGGMQGLPAGRHEFIWAYPGFGTAQQTGPTGPPAPSRCTTWPASPRPTSTPSSPTTPSPPWCGWPWSGGATAASARPGSSRPTGASRWAASCR